MTETNQVTTRFDFDAICAGFVRLVGDVRLADRFHKHIDPDYFFFGDKSLKIRGFREILKQFRKVCDAGEVAKISIEGLGSHIKMMFDSEEGAEGKRLYAWMTTDLSIAKQAADDMCFDIFLNYMKVLHLLKWSKPFMSDYREGNIASAVDSMRDLLPVLDQVKMAEDYQFSSADIDNLLPQDNNSVITSLSLGSPFLDDRMGMYEQQTLNVFLSVTNGGKSMMMQHIIRMCIKQKKTAHVTIVEDRPKSFARRLIASITGIPIRRLKNEFHMLTSEENALIAAAKKAIDEYIRVDFIYGESVDAIQKRKLDYDAERKMKGLEPYLVDVMDYTGHIAHLSTGDKKYDQIHRAYSSRKDFALKRNKIMFDFAQINREGLKRLEDESHFLTHADLAGGFDMSAVCDTIISINRTSKQRDVNKATLYVCKGRDEAAGAKIEVTTDFARGRWHMETATGDLMNAQTRNEVMSQAVAEVQSGHEKL